MKRSISIGAAALTVVTAAGAVVTPAAAAVVVQYTVVAQDGVPPAAAVAAITGAGGTVLGRNDAVGVYRVSASPAFPAAAATSPVLIGAGPLQPIARAASHGLAVPAEPAKAGAGGAAATAGAGLDPLDEKAWGLRMIRADQARTVQQGSPQVTVGVLDTGIETSHPDLGAKVSRELSRSFSADATPVPLGVDAYGSGTHIAGIIGASADGVGVSGIAPEVTLVDLKAGNGDGQYFLEPVVNALTYAADAGIDVVNMSFSLSPWVYNCTANPADSPEAQAEQRAIIAAVRRALDYAHARGVTLVGAVGDRHENLGAPRTDIASPTPGTTYPREIDNASCWSLPVEGPHVIGVSGVGPSGIKADRSNYGKEQVSVAAPGGWQLDGFGTESYNTYGNRIIGTASLDILKREGLVDADGNIVPRFAQAVHRECRADGTCGYYAYLQDTWVAAPHAAGVAALIISQFGKPDKARGGLTMNPEAVERRLLRSAAEHACPTPRVQSYVREGRSAEYDARCTGGKGFNDFYGHGVVDAYAAVLGK